MGFLDKAKRLAEQAQTRLDEIQRQLNESQGQGAAPPSGAPPVEYDQHGRPVPRDPASPQGDPLAAAASSAPDAPSAGGETPAAAPAPPVAPAPAPAAQPEPVDEAPPHGDPLREAGPQPPQPPSTPGLTSGDPLAG